MRLHCSTFFVIVRCLERVKIKFPRLIIHCRFSFVVSTNVSEVPDFLALQTYSKTGSQLPEFFCCPHDFTNLFLHYLPQHCSCCCNACTLVLIPTCSCEGFLCYNGQFLSIYSSNRPLVVL